MNLKERMVSSILSESFDQDFNSFWKSYVNDIKKNGNEVIERNGNESTTFNFDYANNWREKMRGGIKIYANYSNDLGWKANPTKAMKLASTINPEIGNCEELLKFVIESINNRIQFLIRKYKLHTTLSEDTKLINDFQRIVNDTGTSYIDFFTNERERISKKHIWLEGKYKGEKGSGFAVELELYPIPIYLWATNKYPLGKNKPLNPKRLEVMRENILVFRKPINAIKDEKWRII